MDVFFRVNEGEVGALVGQVSAVDADIGQNAAVLYSIKANKFVEGLITYNSFILNHSRIQRACSG